MKGKIDIMGESGKMKNKVLKWSLIGGIYALIPTIISIKDDSLVFFIIFPFIFSPIYMTLLTTLAITELIGINIHEINLLTHIINVILWVLIGAIIGWMIKNRRKDDRNN